MKDVVEIEMRDRERGTINHFISWLFDLYDTIMSVGADISPTYVLMLGNQSMFLKLLIELIQRVPTLHVTSCVRNT